MTVPIGCLQPFCVSQQQYLNFSCERHLFRRLDVVAFHLVSSHHSFSWKLLMASHCHRSLRHSISYHLMASLLFSALLGCSQLLSSLLMSSEPFSSPLSSSELVSFHLFSASRFYASRLNSSLLTFRLFSASASFISPDFSTPFPEHSCEIF